MKPKSRNKTEETKPIKIIIRGGCVEDVQNVPTGVNYKVIDYDNANEDTMERQYLVDNAINDMLQAVAFNEVPLNGEFISEIRDLVGGYLLKQFGTPAEKYFPSLFDDEDEG